MSDLIGIKIPEEGQKGLKQTSTGTGNSASMRKVMNKRVKITGSEDYGTNSVPVLYKKDIN